MTVLVLRKVKPSLKGMVSRWLGEVGGGVYLGTVSARVRDHLWERIAREIGEGGAVLIQPALTEQGYTVRTVGTLPYTYEDFEGLILAKRRISG